MGTITDLILDYYRNHRALRNKRADDKKPPFEFDHLQPRFMLSSVLDLNAATPAPDNITFTDATGDVITIQLEGTGGVATLTSDDAAVVNAGDVDNGEDLTNIDITFPTADFAITISVDSTAGDGVVNLGEVTSTGTILGMYTIADTTSGPVSDFTMDSFTGTALTQGGSINVDTLAGDGAGNALVFTGGLAPGRRVNVSGDITGDVTVAGAFGGTINAGGNVNAGTWTLGPVAYSGFLGAVGGNFAADVTIGGNYDGLTTIDGNATGTWTIQGSVSRYGRLQSGWWSDVIVDGSFDGILAGIDTGTSTGVTVAIGGSMGPNARVLSSDELDLTVGGSVLPGAIGTADSDGIVSTVGGNFSGQFVSYSYVTLAVTGSMVGGEIDAGEDVTLTVGGSMARSRVTTSSEVSATIGGNMSDSTLFAGGSDIVLNLTGSMANSILTSGEGVTAVIGGSVSGSVFEGSEDDTSLTIGGSLLNSEVISGSEHIVAAIGQNVGNTTFLCGSDGVTLTIGGSMIDSDAAGYGGTAVIGGSMIRSSYYSDEGDLTLAIGGNMVDSRASSGSEDVTAVVGGSVLNSRFFAPESDVSLTIGGIMRDSEISADDTFIVAAALQRTRIDSDSGTTLNVTGDMVQTTVVAGDEVTAIVGGNYTGSYINAEGSTTMAVGGNFASGVTSYGSDLTLTVGGAMLPGSTASAADDLVAAVGTTNAAFQADSLDLLVTGDFGPYASVQANEVLDISGDNIGFQVTGNYYGRTDVTTSFDTGTGLGPANIVGGTVARGAKFNVTGTFGTGASAAELAFGGHFLGEFILGTDLDVDLTFGGYANSVVIGGAVNEDITVGHRLNFLSAGSLFAPTGATTGDFVDGAGTVTGTLTAALGYTTVIPPLAVVDAPAVLPFGVLDVNPLTPAPDNGTFTDANGDVITIRLDGRAGTLTITSDDAVTADGLIENGETITNLDITGASADFLVSISVNSAAGIGDVNLGDVTADTLIYGIHTVADTTNIPVSNFVMDSFTGPGFTLGGGLNVDDVAGSALGDGLVLTAGLGFGTAINVSDDFTGDAFFGSHYQGTFNAGGDVTGGQWIVDGSVTRYGFIGGIGGTFDADVQVQGNYSGIATAFGEAGGTWHIRGSGLVDGRLQAEGWDDFRVAGNFDSQLMGVNSSLAGIDVMVDIGGNMGRYARVISFDDLELNVTGHVLPGGMAAAENDLEGFVGGNFYGCWAAESGTEIEIVGHAQAGQIGTQSSLTLTVGGNAVSSLLSGSDATIAVTGTVWDSILSGRDDELTLTVAGNMISSAATTGNGIRGIITGDVSNSSFEASEDYSTFDIAGNFVNSMATGGSEDITARIGGTVQNAIFVTPYEDDVTITIGGDMRDSTAVSESTVLDVWGDMFRSSVYSDESDLTLNVRGSMLYSRATSGSEDVSATVGGDMVRSQFFAGESDVTFSVGGRMVDSLAIGNYSYVTGDIGGDMVNSAAVNTYSSTTLTVGGSVINSRVLAPDDGITLDIRGDMVNSTVAGEGDLTITVGGGFLSSDAHTWDGDITLDVGGAMSYDSAVTSSDDLVADFGSLTGGRVDGAIMADELELIAGGDVGRFATIQANDVLDLFGDNVGFMVGGSFFGRLDVATSFDSGGGARQTLIAGAISGFAKFNVTGSFGGAGAAEFLIGGPVNGDFNLGGDLDVDLLLADYFGKGNISGSVNGSIISRDRIALLTTGSDFTAVSPLAGLFSDGVGTNTGALQTINGYTVVPT